MSNVKNIILGARYGYRFMTVNKSHKSESEKKGLKRMKKFVRNKGKFNAKRIVFVHTVDEAKVGILLTNILRNDARRSK